MRILHGVGLVGLWALTPGCGGAAEQYEDAEESPASPERDGPVDANTQQETPALEEGPSVSVVEPARASPEGIDWEACRGAPLCAVSQLTGGANGPSRNPDVSGDGTVIVFESEANNLGPQDTNSLADIYAIDLDAETIELISQGTGSGADAYSGSPQVSADGRFVAFTTEATDIVEAGAAHSQAYVYDRETGETRRASQNTSGESIHASPQIRLSGDGTKLLMTTGSDNLSPGFVSRTGQHVVLYDLEQDELSVVSAALDGGSGNEISNACGLSFDGGLVSFLSSSSNLLLPTENGSKTLIRDTQTETTSLLDYARGLNDYCPTGPAEDGWLALTSNSSVLVPADDNDSSDVFLINRLSGDIELASVALDGTPAGDSGAPDISQNGRSLVFASNSSQLASGDDNFAGDIFLYRSGSGSPLLISATPDGIPGENASFHPAISADGTSIVFATEADDLFEDDTNELSDVVIVRLTEEN